MIGAPVLRAARLWAAGLALLAAAGWAAETEEDLTELSLEELLGLDVSVGSKTEGKPLRETPGVVTVISGEEIANSGARDLIDVLRLVPGFDFGLDVYEVVGPGLRGNWAYEGKVLLLIDGIVMNERQYGNLALGNHYPVHNIKRVEIIRGPGSVNYGGFAELGVINIVTWTAQDRPGLEIGLNYGQTRDAWLRQTVDLLYGERFANGLELTAAAYAGETRRSDREYVSFGGLRQDMRESSRLDPQFVNLGLRYGNFSSRLLADNYRTTYRNRYGEVEEDLYRLDFKSWSYQAGYIKPLGERLTLDLEGGYTHENAWREQLANRHAPELELDALIEHYWGKAGLKYRYSDKLKLATGVELAWDRSTEKSPLAGRELPDFDSYSGYLEGDYAAEWANLIAGLRYERHNLFGTHLAPRLALTKLNGRFHYKLLYSHAFRIPAVLSMTYNAALQAERSKAWEAEVGYQFNSDMSLVINWFDNQINDTIVYGVDPLSAEETYFNADTTGSRGIETEFRFKQKGYYLTLNHAYYRTAHGVAENQQVIDFQNGTHEARAMLGLPAHKLTLNAHLRLSPEWSFNPSLSWHGPRYGYTAMDEEDNPVLHKFEGTSLLNVFFRYQPGFAKNLEIGLGVYDLLGQDPVFIQPYNGGSAPLPGPSREWRARLRYRFQ